MPKVHCSRATIYRYVGGKNEIRNVVLARAAARIADAVREELEHLSGRERLVSSIILSLQKVRCDPVGKVMIASIRGGTGEVAWLAKSPLLADVATELAGLAGGDPQAAEWVVRVVLSLMFWPGQDGTPSVNLSSGLSHPHSSNRNVPLTSPSAPFLRLKAQLRPKDT